MKRQEIIKAYKALNDLQKKALETQGFYSVTTGNHYGIFASFSLAFAGPEPGFYAPMQRLIKSGYDFKGAKCQFIHFGIVDSKTQEFKGFGCGKVVHIKYIRDKNGAQVKDTDLVLHAKRTELVETV